MAKKDPAQSELETVITEKLAQRNLRIYNERMRARNEYLHGRTREAIEFDEEHPRDVVAERVDKDGVVTHHRVPLRAFYLDERGREVLDPVPVAPPVTQRPLTIFEQLREHNRRKQFDSMADMENWPEANLADEDNFDIPDDPIDPSSQWEETFEVASIAEVTQRARAILAERRAAAAASRASQTPDPALDAPKPPKGSKPPSDPV